MHLIFLCFFLSLPTFANASDMEVVPMDEVSLTLRLKGVQEGVYHVQIKAGESVLCDVTHSFEFQEEAPVIKRYEHGACEDISPHLWAFYPCMSRLFPEVPSIPVTVCANIPLSVPVHTSHGGISLHFTATKQPFDQGAAQSVSHVFAWDTLLTTLSAPAENHYLDIGNGLMYDEETSYMTHVSESCPGQCCVIAHPVFFS